MDCALMQHAIHPESVSRSSLADLVTTNVTHVELSHPATESYMSFETHKCAAMAHAQYQLFALFPPTVPNHSMRSVLGVHPVNLLNRNC